MAQKAQPQSLSIVIPVFNEENYIETCLQAIQAQTIKPLEVIVVDNNSSDRSVEIIKRFPFVTLLREKRQGVTYARDTAFNAARGDIIGRIDADTTIPSNWVETAQKLLDENSQFDALSGPTGFSDLPNRALTLQLTKIIRTALFHFGEPRY